MTLWSFEGVHRVGFGKWLYMSQFEQIFVWKRIVLFAHKQTNVLCGGSRDFKLHIIFATTPWNLSNMTLPTTKDDDALQCASGTNNDAGVSKYLIIKNCVKYDMRGCIIEGMCISWNPFIGNLMR